MKKNIITLFLALASVINLHAAITYEHNGGITNDYRFTPTKKVFEAARMDKQKARQAMVEARQTKAIAPVAMPQKQALPIVNNKQGAAAQVTDPTDTVIGLEFDMTEGSVERTYSDADVVEINTEDVAQYGQLIFAITAADGSDMIYMVFFVEEADAEIGIPAGVYTIDDSGDYGTVYASPGVQDGSIVPSFYGQLSATGGIVPPCYFMVDGQVVVENVNGTLKVTINALNSYDVPAQIVYNETVQEIVETIDIVIEDAAVAIDTIPMFGDVVEYALKMTTEWTNPADGITYPVLVEVPVYYPDATEPYDTLSTVTVGGWGDGDPWLGFGEGALTITTADDVITVTGIVVNQQVGIAIDITISGQLPTPEAPPTITYELNGGVTNDYGWMSKNDMFQACMEDAGVTTLASLDELKAAGEASLATICTPLGTAQCQAILDSEKWDWLEAYIMSVQNADANATVLTEGTASAGWRYAIAAFFLESKQTVGPISADFTLAGAVEVFMPSWQHGFTNPTSPTTTFILNAPYKESYTFAGWYTTPDFSGNKVTTVNAETTGTLYAKWQENSSIYFVNVDNWAKVYVYAWGGGSSMATWPGVTATKEIEQIAGIDVYSFTDEAGKWKNVVFSNNAGNQTTDLTWTSGKYYVEDGWYTKEEAESKLNQSIEYESVYFVNVDDWSSVKIYTWTPEIGAWPGIDMKKEAEKIGNKEVWSHTELKGTSFGGIVFNDGKSGEQTGDLTWNAGKYYVKDGWYTKEEAESKLNQSIEYESVYFVNVDNWANVYVFAWNERSSIASWPGVAATKEIEQIAGIDVYSFTDEAGKWQNVIFSNNVGDRTYDLIWTSGKYYVKDGWYTKEEAESKLSPTITYELNGGITNDYGWMSKGDMFTACITDALGYDLGMTLDEFKHSATPFDDLFGFFGKDSLCQNILDNARWDWLEDYLITIQEEDQLAVPLTKGVASKDWRYAIAAFFFESQYDTSSDYSQAGKDEAYIPYWKHGYDNPTQPTQEWVLNAPYKENYLFDGWYATNTFTDEPITTVNASTNGTLYAKWKNEIVSSDTVGICFYDTYYWDINDEIYDRTGTYYATDEEGKHVLHLTVYPLTEDVEIFDTIRAGEIYDFEGRELTQTGTYYEAMLDDNGCDYTITLHLTVVHEEYVNICQGETYTWAVNSQIYSETGTYNLTTNDGIFILHLTVNPLIYTEETITTCDSYQWNGQTYTQSGDYTYTTTATNGCDSTITLHLTINQTQYAEETITACDSYDWNGQTFTQSGDYTYSTTAINGCDSIATLHLLVYQSKHTEEHITACDNYDWNGQTYTESGTYTHTSTTIDGCDSIVTLHLTINNSEIGETENVTICHGETYTWNGQTYSTAGEYSVTLSNTNGCDSTATLHLTIMPQAQEEVQYETINKKETPFIWQKNSKKYYETTTDSIFIPYTHYDCDSMIYILDLTVVDIEDVRAEYDTICESALPYEWHGQSITTGGRYEYTEKYGDTNIDILNVLYLTVIPTIRTQQSAIICYEETFAWNGNTYSQTGTYTYTTEAANGCDSVVTLYLTVLPPAITIYTDTMIAHVDLPYIWRGQYCDTSGEYTATIPFAANTACDSVIYVLNLTVESVNKCGADLSWEYDNGILTISGSGAMYDNPDLQSYRHESWYPYRVRQVILSDQLTHIGNVAFADCANLTNIDIPSSVTSIGDGAFSWTGLLSVTLPASVTELGEQVFETCNNLHTILYEGTPSSISNQTVHPFIGCVHLDTIITPAELWHCTSADPVLENRYGVPHKARYIEVTNGFLTNQAMKYIAKNATTLKVLDLTYATNTTLPYGALSDSYQLSTLYLPQQIEVIPESMIEGGRNLTEILIPATVTEIGNNAFAGCTNVWRMTVEAVLPPKAYDKTFDGIDRSISLIVPAGSEDLYRQAEYWREFFIEHTNSLSPITHCQKLLHEDHILILREGKVYTTMGQLINVGE